MPGKINNKNGFILHKTHLKSPPNFEIKMEDGSEAPVGGAFSDPNRSVSTLLNECIQRLQKPESKKCIQEKLRTIARKGKFINVDEPLEVKTMRVCFPIIVGMLSDVVNSDSDSSSCDKGAELIRFLYEAKRQSVYQPEVEMLLQQLQAIVRPVLEASEHL